MGVIKPTLTIVSNAESAATEKGPLSIALNLTAKPKDNTITIDNVKSGIYDFTNTTQVNLFTDALEDGDTAGLHGSFIYLKNTSPGDHDIYIGYEVTGTGPTSISGAGADDRVGTLKQGEFLFMPYDYCGDFVIQAENAACTLEWWMFDRN